MKNKYGPSVLNLVRLSSRYRKKAVWAWVEGFVAGVVLAGIFAWVAR